jgi:hypothetical protein
MKNHSPKKPPDLIKGPDSGFGFGQESLNKLEAGEALEPVEGVSGMPVIRGSDRVLASGTGRVIGAAKYTHFAETFLLLHLSQVGRV